MIGCFLGLIGLGGVPIHADLRGVRVAGCIDENGVGGQIPVAQPAALIVSNEAHGPSSAAQAFSKQAGGFISIPMEGDAESLNAASAAAVLLFEAARQRRVHR